MQRPVKLDPLGLPATAGCRALPARARPGARAHSMHYAMPGSAARAFTQTRRGRGGKCVSAIWSRRGGWRSARGWRSADGKCSRRNDTRWQDPAASTGAVWAPSVWSSGVDVARAFLLLCALFLYAPGVWARIDTNIDWGLPEGGQVAHDCSSAASIAKVSDNPTVEMTSAVVQIK